MLSVNANALYHISNSRTSLRSLCGDKCTCCSCAAGEVNLYSCRTNSLDSHYYTINLCYVYIGGSCTCKPGECNCKGDCKCASSSSATKCSCSSGGACTCPKGECKCGDKK